MAERAVTVEKSEKAGFFYGYVVVATACFILFMMAGTLYSYGVFLKPLGTEFGWPRGVTAGAYSTCISLVGVLFMVTGRLTDRFGPRLVTTVCGVVISSGYLLMSRVNTIWQLYLFFGVVVPIGQSGGLIPMMSTVSRWFVRRRGLATGIVVAGVGVGQVIIPPVAAKLINIYGWRTSYEIVGVALLSLVVAAQFLRRDPSQVGQLPDGAGRIRHDSTLQEVKGLTLREALHTRQMWMLCAMYLCYGFIVHSIMVHTVPHATDLGVSAVAAASLLSVIGGMTTVSRIFMGNAGDRIGNRQGLIVAFSVALAAFLWVQLADTLWMLYLFAIIFGFAYGGLVALEAPVAAELFGLRAHGTILGVVHFCVTVGGGISTALVGELFDITGSYRLAFLAFAVFSATGITLAAFLRSPAGIKRIDEPKRDV